MENLINVDTKKLLKVFFGKKEFYYIVNNKLKSTNKELDFQTIDNLEYLFVSSDFETMFNIKETLIKRLDLLSNSWTKMCYYYTNFNTFIQNYGLSQNDYYKLLKLQK